MLRLIMDSRLSSPADYKQHRDSINMFIQQRGDRIDDVPLAAVLHINHRNFSCRQMVACGKGRTISFICCNHMMLWVNSIGIHEIITKGF